MQITWFIRICRVTINTMLELHIVSELFLTQQEDSCSYLRLVNGLENFIREKKVNSIKQAA